MLEIDCLVIDLLYGVRCYTTPLHAMQWKLVLKCSSKLDAQPLGGQTMVGPMIDVDELRVPQCHLCMQ